MPFASTPTTVDRAFDLRAFLAAPPLGLSDYGDLESALSTYGATSLAFLANTKPEDLQTYGGIPIGKAAAIVNVAKMRVNTDVNTDVKPSAGPSAPPPDELAQNPQAMQLAVELTQNPQMMEQLQGMMMQQAMNGNPQMLQQLMMKAGGDGGGGGTANKFAPATSSMGGGGGGTWSSTSTDAGKTINCHFTGTGPIGLDLMDGPANTVLLKSQGKGLAAGFGLRPNDVLTSIKYKEQGQDACTLPKTSAQALLSLGSVGRPVTLVFVRESKLQGCVDRTQGCCHYCLHPCGVNAPMFVGVLLAPFLWVGVFLLVFGLGYLTPEEGASQAQRANWVVWGVVTLSAVILLSPVVAFFCGFTYCDRGCDESQALMMYVTMCFPIMPLALCYEVQQYGRGGYGYGRHSNNRRG
jgi:hypothetical protein